MDCTAYHFYIRNESFDEALNIFSQYFISPLINPEYVDKEMNAVNSEFVKNINNDIWRKQNLLRLCSNPKSLYNMFSTGNLDTLKIPKIHEKLKKFYNDYYR
jgi:insulysin